MNVANLQNKSVTGCYSDLIAELSFLFLQFSQSETKPWSVLQLLFPQGLRVMGIVGKHTLLLHLSIEPSLHYSYYQPQSDFTEQDCYTWISYKDSILA